MLLKKCLFKAIFLAVLLSGCVTVPQQTGELTVMLGNQIAESKITHLALIEEWSQQRRARAEQFLNYRWIPTFIMNFMDEEKKDSPYNNLKKAMASDCRMDRADEIKEIVEAISEQIEKKRAEIFWAIDSQTILLKTEVNTHYAEIERMHRSILANIQSAVKGGQFEKDIRNAMMRPLKEIAPINEASKALDKLLEEGK